MQAVDVAPSGAVQPSADGEAQQLHARLVELTAQHHRVLAEHLDLWRREQEDLLSQLSGSSLRQLSGSLLLAGRAPTVWHQVEPPPEGDMPSAPGEPGRCWESKTGLLADASQKQVETSPSIKKSKKKSKKADNRVVLHTSDFELTPLQRFVTNTKYEAASCALILLNALFLGIQAEVKAVAARGLADAGQDPKSFDDDQFLPLQIVFCLLFCLDLGLRWAADGLLEFFHHDFNWNVFDVIIVGMNIMDIFLALIFLAMSASSPEFLSSTSVLRVLRLIRIVRVARVIRVLRFFRELRMMVFSILASMKSLLWVCLVLVVVWYIFAIIFTVSTVTHLDSVQKWRASENADLIFYFSSLGSSILHLYMAMSGGNDWSAYFHALEQISLGLASLLLFYILFVVFAVCNIVTAVFVDAAMLANQHDKMVVVHEQLEEQREIKAALQDIFEEIDADGTGIISMEELEAKICTERVVAYFRTLGLEVSDARTLFMLLDHNNSDAVDMDEFLYGCFHLLGEAKTLDMKIMMYELRYISENLRHLASSQPQCVGAPTHRPLTSTIGPMVRDALAPP